MALKRISGLWLKSGKRGQFMSGSTTATIPAGAKLLVFRNDRKQGDNDPDYTLQLAVDDDQPSPGGQHRSPPTDNRDDPGGFRAESAAIAACPQVTDVPF